MKINLPMNVSPTRSNTPAKSTVQTDSDAMGLFSIQMNKILSQSDEKGGVGGYSRSGYDESGDDTPGSMSSTNTNEIESTDVVRGKTEREENKQSDVSASEDTQTKRSNGPDGKTENVLQKGDDPGMVSGAAGSRADADTKLHNSHTPGISAGWTAKGQKTANPTPESNSAEEIPVSNGSGRIQKNFTESDSSLFGFREGLNASEGRPGHKQDIQTLNTGHENRVTGALESGTAGEKQMPVADPLNRQDAAERNGFARMPDPAGVETSTKTSAENTPSNGNSEESGNNSGQTATAKTFQVNGNISQAAAGRDTIQVKSFQTELSAHISAGSVPMSGSNAPVGSNAARPVAPQSNQFLSQVTEQIHFLIRDGRDAIRIRLQPDEFGYMEIRAESTARGMAVRILAETGSVKSVLENNLHILQHNLQELGLKVDRIQIMLQDFFDYRSNTGHFSKSGHSNSEQYEKGSRRNLSGNGNSHEDAVRDNDDVSVYIPDVRFHTVA